MALNVKAPSAQRPPLLPGLARMREGPWFGRSIIVIILLAAFAYPIIDGSVVDLDTAYLAEIYILLALGLNVVVGFAGLLDLGYAAFFAIGAYTAGTFASTHWSVGTHTISNMLFTIGPGGIHLDFIILVPLAALVAACFGIVFGAPTLRLRGDYLAIVTLGFGEIVPIVAAHIGPNDGLYFGRGNTVAVPNITNGVNSLIGIDGPPPFSIFGAHVTFTGNDGRSFYYLAFGLIILSLLVIHRLRASRIGRCWVAIREDEVAAAHAGISVTGTRLTAFAIGAAFSGFGGLLYASNLHSIDPTAFSFNVSVSILVMVILGGIGSVPGAMIGGVIIAYLSQTWLTTAAIKLNQFGGLIRGLPGPVGAFGAWLHTAPFSTAKPLIFGVILVGMMLLRPQGLLPDRRRARELRPETPMELQEENEELWTVQTGEI